MPLNGIMELFTNASTLIRQWLAGKIREEIDLVRK